tara:strand:- start:6383 stop:9172 length:2790 start_codon:yes stop_codon:yes gene_type:complete
MTNIIIPSNQYRAQNVRIITYKEMDKVALEDTQLNYLKNIFKQYKGQTIQISKRHRALSGTEIITDTQISEVPKSGFNSWWDALTKGFIYPDSEDHIFQDSYNPEGPASEQTQITIMTADRVNKGNYEQFFLDGTTHCLFTPMMNWAIDLSMNAGTESTRRKYDAKANKIQKLMNEYKEGVPEKDIPSICNQLQIGIEIDLPSCIMDKKTQFIKVRSQKKPIKNFRFINTRLNHVELNEITNKDNYEEVSQKELKQIFDKEKKFKLWKGDREGALYQINTLDKVYKLTEEEGYSKEVKDFSDLNNLDQFKIEHNSQKLLSNFLLNNVNSNNTVILDNPYELGSLERSFFKEYLKYPDLMEKDEKQFIKDNNDEYFKKNFIKGYEANMKKLEIINYIHSIKKLNHIDLKRAYTKGHECTFYEGYLGKITDFRKTKKIEALGIYMIHNIQNVPPLIKKLGILYENNAYPSPELKFYQSLGITFDISCGCWGSKTDITWTDGMFEKDEKGTKHYCKWYGCLMKLTTKERYNFSCDNLEFAELNNISDNSDIRYNQHKKTGIIEYDKDKIRHSAHIASFIHSYCRISMIEQLLKFKDITQIFAVQTDGIFYKGDVEVGNLFVSKPAPDIKYVQGDKYVINCQNDKPKFTGKHKYRKHNLRELHMGPGGAGKTHNNLIDEGLIAPIYIAPSWKLARNKAQEYNIDSSVYHYLTCKDPQVWMTNLRYYNTLIIDEISMLSNEEKNIILKRFKNHKIIFCGDLGYQLPPVEGSKFIIGDIPIFNHRKNYRCQCEKLQFILNDLRKLIKNDYEGTIKDLLLKYDFQITDKNLIDYSVEDLILTKTHKNKDFYSQRYKHIEKYLVKENTLDFSNGEIIIGKKPDKVLADLQHAFTIHSIQGETCKTNLFIDINKMNSLPMLYTALSRAKFLSQIKIIE